MKAFSKTDIGKKRQVNQDYVFVSLKPVGTLPNLFVVADGMGGHNAGDFASKFTVNVLREELAIAEKMDPKQMFQEVISKANHRLIEEAHKNPDLEGMGTTLVVATIIEKTLYFANIGDSRLYVIGKEIKQISKDHSLVEEMVRLGGLRAEEAKHHPDKNIITRAIGGKEDVEADLFEYHLEESDVVLMCTDGLSNMLEDEEIYTIVKSRRDIVDGVEKLIDQANANGGNDNIGVILAEPFAGEVEVRV